MSLRGWLRNTFSIRLLLCLCVAVLIALVFFGVYKRPGNSIPFNSEESLNSKDGKPFERLNAVNQELIAQIRKLQEEVRLIAEERDNLKEDKAQLLYMVEKLQQQSAQSSPPEKESSLDTKMVRSWLVRISELRNTKVREDALSRNEYVKEVNEVVRGLKEDCAEDTFIMGIGYAKTSSRIKNDINTAQKKLDDIVQYLKQGSSGAD
ncbi:MAG: hypothetical protein EHM79_19585 [Geobacter sp.]|nr:MAG: hypothetical protein EHM79_19585 [Geobacter sp.]